MYLISFIRKLHLSLMVFAAIVSVLLFIPVVNLQEEGIILAAVWFLPLLMGIFRITIQHHAKIEPETPVEIWILEEYDEKVKVQLLSTTWEEYKHKKASTVLSGDYGPGNPLIILLNTVERRLVGMTLDLFQAEYGNIRTISGKQLVEMRDKMGDDLTEAINKAEKLLSRLSIG